MVDDIRIFAVFALLNLAGYEEENSSWGMHPIRQFVRQELIKTTAPGTVAKAKSYYEKHQATATPWTYSVVIMATDGPPNFAFNRTWDELRQDKRFAALTGVPALVKELYSKGRVPVLFERTRAEYEKNSGQYRNVIQREVLAVLRYCRVERVSELAGGGERKKAVVIPNLLESYERAFSFVLADTFYSVEGTQKSFGYNPHEFVHSVTNHTPPSTVRSILPLDFS